MNELSQIRQGALAPANTADMAEAMIASSGLRIEIDRRRGRGAAINSSGRFEPVSRQLEDDGWDSLEDLPVFKTEVQIEKPRSIISRNDSPDIPFDRSVNPYRGCEHGCIYCFARPTHAYMGLSPGLDFEAKLFAKPDAAKLLERELAKPGYKVRPIAIGTNTDPYQPIEKEWRIMRQILEVLKAADHPVMIVTKSAMVMRDIDILAPMAEKGLAKVGLSVTTLDRKLARLMEPRASTPSKRLEAIKALSEAGIPSTVMMAPVIPASTTTRSNGCWMPARRLARQCELCAAAPADRSQPAVSRLAAAALSGPLPPRHVAGPLDARRQGLRRRVRQAHEGCRSLCLADRPPFRAGDQAAGTECHQAPAEL
jgi:DNA repair photolyase